MSASVLDLHFRQQVEELFDTYAPNFEEELAALGYDVPAIVEAELLAERAPLQNLSRTLAVDLGCGTGWAGARLRPHCAGRLIGCDLSKGILREARAKGVFDALEQMDAVAFLHRRDANSADLIVESDRDLPQGASVWLNERFVLEAGPLQANQPKRLKLREFRDQFGERPVPDDFWRSDRITPLVSGLLESDGTLWRAVVSVRD